MTDPHRTPVAEGSLADPAAIALNNFLKSILLPDGGTKERVGGEFMQRSRCAFLFCMRLGSMVIEEIPVFAADVLQPSID